MAYSTLCTLQYGLLALFDTQEGSPDTFEMFVFFVEDQQSQIFSQKCPDENS